MRRIPPLNSMRAFEAAARHMSFKHAAVELGVTPTAISHQIKLLEDTIGHMLFRRNPKPMVLTEVGEHLFPTVRDSFDNLAQAISDVAGASENNILRVSTTSAFASNILLPRLSEWSREYPNLELEIHASDYLVNLREENIDVAVRYAAKSGHNMVWRELFSDYFCPMVAPFLLSENAKLPMSPADIFQLPLIKYRWKDRHYAEPTWEKWRYYMTQRYGQSVAMSKAQIIRLSEESHALQAAISGQGAVLASSVIANSHCHAEKLLPVSDIVLPGLTYYLVHLPHHANSKGIAVFEKWLSNILYETSLDGLPTKLAVS